MDSLPDKARVGKALDYLVGSDEPYARACAALEAAEMRVKQTREIAFLEAEGTQAERSALANSSETVREAQKAYEEAYYRKELLKARRSSALVVIDVWRSLEASARHGV